MTSSEKFRLNPQLLTRILLLTDRSEKEKRKNKLKENCHSYWSELNPKMSQALASANLHVPVTYIEVDFRSGDFTEVLEVVEGVLNRELNLNESAVLQSVNLDLDGKLSFGIFLTLFTKSSEKTNIFIMENPVVEIEPDNKREEKKLGKEITSDFIQSGLEHVPLIGKFIPGYKVIKGFIQMWSNVIAELHITYGDNGKFSVAITETKAPLPDIEYIRLWIYYLTALLYVVKGHELESFILDDLSLLHKNERLTSVGVFNALGVGNRFVCSNQISNISLEIQGTYTGWEHWNRGTFRYIRTNIVKGPPNQQPEIVRYSVAALLDFVIIKIKNNRKVQDILFRTVRIYLQNYPNPGGVLQFKNGRPVPLIILQKWAVEQAEKEYIEESSV